MKNLFGRPTPAGSGKGRAARPVVEGLEGRVLMFATSGDHFAFGSRITWSIVPDGTSLGGGVTSNLISTLDNRLGAGNWEPAVAAAFAAWEQYANINLVQVSDDGSPSGSGNYQQGSPSVGDIRISGYAQASGILGFTLLPPPANGGSSAGDIFLNSAQPWQLGANYDLETVMIHEAGHALGMGHSTDTGAAMYPYYSTVQQFINQDDLNGIQAIWGPRQEDGFALGNANYVSSANAANLTSLINGQNQLIVGPLDIAGSGESYWFKVTTPANASNAFSVAVQSTNLSELSPKVQLYDSNVHGLAQATSPANVFSTTIGVSITNATPNTTYYIKISGSNVGPTGTGAYGLLVNMGATNPPLVSPPNTVVYAQPNQGGGGTYDRNGGDAGPHDPRGGSDGGDARVGSGSWAGSRDVPTWITIGSLEYQGDYFTVNAASDPGTAGVAGLTPTTDFVPIPIDPTTSTPPASTGPASASASVRLGHPHPLGPA